jgi:hypothetical protein
VGYASGKTERLRNNDLRADDLIRIRTAEGLLADLCLSAIGIVGAMAIYRQLILRDATNFIAFIDLAGLRS